MSDFRVLATALADDDVIATAKLDMRMDGTVDRTVRIWTIADTEPRVAFDTVLEGPRLALCDASDGLMVVTGAWERHGICAYDGRTGERLWQRKDLKKVQAVSPTADGAVAACFDMRPMHLLDLATGSTIATVRGVRRFWQSPYQRIGAGEVLGHVALIGTDDWTVQARVPVAGFALLAAAFAPAALLVSNTVDRDTRESCSVYCVSVTGQILWERQMPAETNAPWLGYDAEADEWLGIRHHVGQREPDTPMRWTRGGDLVARDALGHGWEYAILPGGRLLVMGGGEVIETKGLTRVGRLGSSPD